MPNLVVEYADPVAERVNVAGLLDDLHRVMVDSDLFEPDAVKTRGYPCHHWLIGDDGTRQTFIHLELSLLAGRTLEQKKPLVQALMAELEKHCGDINSLTIDVRDMDTNAFLKVSC
ncbi:5-carboxymethyl-2-hydroxymuconate isomerase [Photobacterium jeanii]|uniref:5-carboxymethyl-2-hydroxymuconate isomerase n=1 Tax=Photobacterium jeanii TaxID=858640 RepID=A0A178KIS5_9GAMM|nr:5-carboxymethyl-2-hydroxymuconate Delta-isomerase [Photobacterium jeanii]OAN17026.1 5-carboxymethyl-2-hydroxymuconate isomerase [Photobacterium jeanii]PST88315.1 5-carboxymethyl-2-hydroxymuconate isomerase [Photobacterium jeanii]